jgi:cell division protein FtsI/penicillin-binding protein 2
MAYRFSAVIAVLVAAYGFLLFHLYQLQFIQGGYYLARADSETAASADLNANRGAIYFIDNQGKTLPAAVNQEFPVIYAVPSAVQNPASAAATLAPILNLSVSALKKIFTNGSSYHLLVNKADDSTVQKVNDAIAAGLKGVYTDYEPERYYPLGSVGSQVLGYVGPNASNTGESGHYGVEGFYNDALNGTATSTGGVGEDVSLTIDPNIQAEAEKILDGLVTANGATGGSVIIEDPQTGKILAMGATPSFDPNDYSSSPIANFLDPNVESVYEPGSIFKVLTMAAGIDAGKISPNTTYDDKGYVNVDGAHITNYNLTTYGAYGPDTTMTEVIEHSINTGAIFAENQTGDAIFTAYMKRFRLDQKTGIDLPGEVTGNLSQLNPKSPQVDFDTAAYGQGVAVTPIELVQSIAAIANGGVVMRPYVNAMLSPKPLGRAISTSTATEVTQMMTAAIDNVSGAPSISGYALAGKTGSAFVPNPKGGGYLNELDDSYIGFGPTSNPKFIVFIRLNTLPVTSLAVDSVVPGFKELAQYIINYYNIPPDRAVAGN